MQRGFGQNKVMAKEFCFARVRATITAENGIFSRSKVLVEEKFRQKDRTKV